MKRILLFLAWAVLFTGVAPAREVPGEPRATPPASTSIRYEGGDGSCLEQAVIIKGAKNSTAGVRAEYDWVEKKFPGYRRKQQSLRASGGKRYDVLSILTKDGKEVDVHFDITEFFGKF